MAKNLAISLLLPLLLSGCQFLDMPGRERDEHGCLGSGGYSWCPATNQCERLCDDKGAFRAQESDKPNNPSDE